MLCLRRALESPNCTVVAGALLALECRRYYNLKGIVEVAGQDNAY
jgi:hypothetical protein